MENKSQYNIGVFFIKIINLGQAEMVRMANQESERIFDITYKLPGSKDFRDKGSIDYLQKLRSLRYFLASQRLPGGLSLEEMGFYRKIAERLITREEWPPSVLEYLD